MTNDEAVARWPKLAGVHPVLIRKLARVLVAMDALGFPMKPVQGVRSAEYQHALWQQGREKPGAIVTNADGIAKKSNHQIADDGLGHAVDCAFVLEDGSIGWDDHLPWDAYGQNCKAVGLVWGIHLNATTIDRPHAELRKLV